MCEWLAGLEMGTEFHYETKYHKTKAKKLVQDFRFSQW